MGDRVGVAVGTVVGVALGVPVDVGAGVDVGVVVEDGKGVGTGVRVGVNMIVKVGSRDGVGEDPLLHIPGICPAGTSPDAMSPPKIATIITGMQTAQKSGRRKIGGGGRR